MKSLMMKSLVKRVAVVAAVMVGMAMAQGRAAADTQNGYVLGANPSYPYNSVRLYKADLNGGDQVSLKWSRGIDLSLAVYNEDDGALVATGVAEAGKSFTLKAQLPHDVNHAIIAVRGVTRGSGMFFDLVTPGAAARVQPPMLAFTAWQFARNQDGSIRATGWLVNPAAVSAFRCAYQCAVPGFAIAENIHGPNMIEGGEGYAMTFTLPAGTRQFAAAASMDLYGVTAVTKFTIRVP